VNTCHTYQPIVNQPQQVGMGFIGAAIGLVATLVPLVISAFKNKKGDDSWSKWPQSKKQEYVRQSIVLASAQNQTGEAASVDQAMKNIIAKVYPGDWNVWKKSNPTETRWIMDAEAESNKTSSLGLSSTGGLLIWGIAITAVGAVVWPKVKPIVFSKKDSQHIKSIELKN